MAKTSAIQRNLKRIKLAKKFRKKEFAMLKKLLKIKNCHWMKDLKRN